MKIQFKKFSDFGKIPTKVTPDSACFDIFSTSELKIIPEKTKQIPLDVGFKFSKKLCCRIYPRSGVSLLPTFIGGGVVDSDFRGNIQVILTKFSSSDVFIKIGDKSAQIMSVKPIPVCFEEVSNFPDQIARGLGGFG